MTALFLESQVNTDGDFLVLLALLQFMVGFVQVFGALIRTLAALVAKQSLKKMMIYWLMVVVYFTILYLFIDLHWNELFWFPFAWVIAIWYWVKIVFSNFNNHSKASKSSIINL
jgi:high-affinity K+ transport system ATPase subunit B